jgi:hypothetical protein
VWFVTLLYCKRSEAPQICPDLVDRWSFAKGAVELNQDGMPVVAYIFFTQKNVSLVLFTAAIIRHKRKLSIQLAYFPQTDFQAAVKQPPCRWSAR